MSFLTRSKRLILTLSLSAIIPCAQASNDTITLGVSSRVPNVNEDLILKTERVLTDHFGPKNFRIVHYSLDGLVEAIKEGEVDIFLSSAGLYRRMSSEGVRDLVALALRDSQIRITAKAPHLSFGMTGLTFRASRI